MMESQKELRLCTSDINTVVSSMGCFIVVYILKAITYMYLTFTSKKQVSKGLLTGEQKQTFSLSKRELCLHESERVSPNARSRDFRMKGKCTLLERALSRLEI